MLGCCVFKNSKNLPASYWQLKRHYIINILSIQNYFTFSKCIYPQSFIATHQPGQDQRQNPLQHHLFGRKTYFKKENMYLMSIFFLNSALVIFKFRLCSNNKLTAILIVSLSGILVNKLQTLQEIKNLLVAITFFISSQDVNESFVQWDVGMIRSGKSVRNVERW